MSPRWCGRRGDPTVTLASLPKRVEVAKCTLSSSKSRSTERPPPSEIPPCRAPSTTSSSRASRAWRRAPASSTPTFPCTTSSAAVASEQYDTIFQAWIDRDANALAMPTIGVGSGRRGEAGAPRLPGGDGRDPHRLHRPRHDPVGLRRARRHPEPQQPGLRQHVRRHELRDRPVQPSRPGVAFRARSSPDSSATC